MFSLSGYCPDSILLLDSIDKTVLFMFRPKARFNDKGVVWFFGPAPDPMRMHSIERPQRG